MVEVAALDRSGGGDVGEVLASVVAELRGPPPEDSPDPPADQTDREQDDRP